MNRLRELHDDIGRELITRNLGESVVFKRKKYPAKVAQYTNDLLLVGINYDKETKSHSCVIERWGDDK